MLCYKLGIKFGRSDMVKKFLVSERTGFYLAVLQEGEVGVGDRIERIAENQPGVKVSDITRLYTREKDNTALLRRAIAVEALHFEAVVVNLVRDLTGPSTAMH
jgi:MOSC domain-containing protein YiiM